METSQNIEICLEKQYYRFRWKSEVKTNITDKTSAHGDYLKGTIKLPSNLGFARYKLELSLIPSIQSDASIFKAHPYILHLTHPESYHPLSNVNKESWKLTFDIDAQNGVILKNHNGSTLSLSFDKNSPFIALGPKNIMITIVKPVVKATSDLNIADVLEERFIHELRDDTNARTEAEELANMYRQSGIELPRCRLKATLTPYLGAKLFDVMSDDIFDSGDKNVGNFAVDLLSEPHYFCTNGGWRSLITSKYPCSSQSKKRPQIKPAFVVQESRKRLIAAEEYFEEIYNIKFQQISKYENSRNRILFEIPEQNDHRFLQYGLSIPLYITLKRPDSCKPFADDKVQFTYMNHKEQSQCICDIIKPRGLELKEENSMEHQRSRSNSRSRFWSTSSTSSFSRSSSYDKFLSPNQGFTPSNLSRSQSQGSVASGSDIEMSKSPSVNSSVSSGFYSKSNRTSVGITSSSINDQFMSSHNEMEENRTAFLESILDVPMVQKNDNPYQSMNQPFTCESIDFGGIHIPNTSNHCQNNWPHTISLNENPMETPSIYLNDHNMSPQTSRHNFNQNQNADIDTSLENSLIEQRWLNDAQVNQPFKPNTISAASNIEWMPGIRPQRSHSESAFEGIDWYEEDQTSKILDEFLNNELEKSKDSINTSKTVTANKQIPLSKIFDNKDMSYSKSNRKRRRTEETAIFNKAFDTSSEIESMDAMVGFLDCQGQSRRCSSNTGESCSHSIKEHYLKVEEAAEEECKDTLHLSLEYDTMKKKKTLTARLVKVFQKLKKKEKDTSYQLYCLTL